MKKLVLVAVLLLGLSAVAMAQDVPTAEVFGGYSYFRCDASQVQKDATCNLNGWDAAVDFNFNKNWGAVIDVSGHYGWFETAATWPYYDVKSHNFLFGPRFTARYEKVTPFVQALFGINHVNPDKEFGVQNNFAMAFGGGVDVKVNDKISVRPVQVDYMTTRVSSEYTNNFRYSAGIVFKFGKR